MGTIDLILFNGKVFIKNDRDQDATAVAITGGRFVTAGTDKEILRYRCGHTDVIDLGGRPLRLRMDRDMDMNKA